MAIFHQFFEPNKEGRDFVVGDLHGMVLDLHEALNKQNFNKDVDRVFSVGDLIDRGASSESALALLAEPWFFSVMGNHEEQMIAVADGEDPTNWFRFGGGWAEAHMKRGSFQGLVTKIRDLPIGITIDMGDGRMVGISHAEPGLDVWTLDEDIWSLPKVRKVALWGRTLLKEGKAVQTKGVDLTIHGHTPIGTAKRLGNAVFIDTGCVYGEHLTVITLEEAFNLPCSGK